MDSDRRIVRHNHKYRLLFAPIFRSDKIRKKGGIYNKKEGSRSTKKNTHKAGKSSSHKIDGQKDLQDRTKIDDVGINL